MSTSYRIVDLRSTEDSAEHIVTGAKSPEMAARDALGIELVRSGSPKLLAAKVYWKVSGDEPINVVRLYNKVDDPRWRR